MLLIFSPAVYRYRISRALFTASKSTFQYSKSFFATMASKPKVYVTRGGLPNSVISALNKRCQVTSWTEDSVVPRDELLRGVSNVDALYCMLTDKIDSQLLDAAGPNLKVVGTVSVGFDHIDVKECKKRNIKIGYTPGILTNAAADLTVALLLSTARRLIEGAAEVLNGGWKTWHPFWMCGQELTDSTVGIVGLGRIGQAVVKRLIPFGVVRFLYCGRKPNPDGDAFGAKYVSFDELLMESDYVIVSCSLNSSTKGLFGYDAMKKMKRNAILINTSRGPVVDQEALYEALTKKWIWAAGLDVTTPEPLPPDHPLTSLKNCVILPHIGTSTEKTRDKMAMMTVDNIIAALDGKQMPAELVVD